MQHALVPVAGSRNNVISTVTNVVLFISLLGSFLFSEVDAATLTTLHAFTGTDGNLPYAGVTQGSDGNFYGTTLLGGAANQGTVFQLSSGGTLTILHSFTGGADGANPKAGLARGSDGNFYGAAGTLFGTLFKVSPSGNFTLLHTLVVGEGASPNAALIQTSDGSFYGTTLVGGVGGLNSGSIFKITPAGVFTTLYSFSGGTDGGGPTSSLVQGVDGNLYGTALVGGSTVGSCATAGCGTVFKITPSGVFSTLHVFTGSDGIVAQAGLALGSDGNLYGTTVSGGASVVGCSTGCGTIFKITPDGVFTSLYSFAPDVASGGGAGPIGGLVAASDGNFYGTTGGGGASGGGTIFKVTPAGAVTTLYSFTGGADGVAPQAVLIQGSDGALYGTTTAGGATGNASICNGVGCGTVFKLDVGLAVAAPPMNVAATAGNAQVALSWTASTGATSYNVYQGTSPGGESATPVKTGITSTGATITDLNNGTTYYFTVSAVSPGGTSAQSSEANAVPVAPATPPPSPPTSLAATAGDAQATLSWTASSGAASYNIYQGTSAGGESATPVKTGITGTSTTIAGLTNGTTYYFKVAAVSAAGTSALSTEATVTPAQPVSSASGSSKSGGGALNPFWLVLLAIGAAARGARSLYLHARKMGEIR